MKKRPNRHLRLKFACLVFVALIAGYSGWALLRPLPALTVEKTNSPLSLKTEQGVLDYPAGVQAAVGIVGSDIMTTSGEQKGVPTASTAKLITALAVLNKKPLQPGEQGPLVTLTAADVAIYNQYVAQDGSVVPVQVGEQISEYQMLQALMLPSANNIADSMAIWAYGSLGAYTTAANSYVTSLGLTQTHVGSDASGLAPDTTSSARDLVKLGEAAMANPVLASIVGQTTATNIPVAGTVSNVNFLLGKNNIVGIKTGNSDQAGGVFVSASQVILNNKPVIIITAVAGTPDLGSALKTSLTLIQSAQKNFKTVSLLRAGAVVGHYKQPWANDIAITTADDLNVTTWGGNTITAQLTTRPIGLATTRGQHIGTARSEATTLQTAASTPLALASAPSQPSAWWRLVHPYN